MLSILIPTCKPEVSLLIQEIRNTLYNNDAEIVASCQPVSAAVNRNWCLNNSAGELLIMLDDDITKFPMYWDKMLLETLKAPNVGIVSPRLMKIDGSYAYSMGDPHIYEGVVDSIEHGIPTACICFRRNPIRFDPEFRGSGFEDTDYIKQWRKMFPNDRFVINNVVKVVHLNEMKGQKGPNWDHNKAHFLQKWSDEKDVWHS